MAFVSAKLCDVWPDGTSSLLSRGLLNLAHRASSTDPEAGADFTVRWEDATVRARAEVTLDASPTTYDVEVSLQTWCDGEPFAARSWSRSIPRDLG